MDVGQVTQGVALGKRTQKKQKSPNEVALKTNGFAISKFGQGYPASHGSGTAMASGMFYDRRMR